MKLTQTCRTTVILLFLLPILAHSQELSPIDEAEDRRDVSAPILEQAVQSRSADERVRVALALGRMQKPELIPLLVRLMHDREANVVAIAAWSAGQLGWLSHFARGQEAALVSEVQRLLVHPDATVRAHATRAIGKLALAKTPELIAAALKDPDERVRAEALMSLFRHRLVMQLRGMTPPTPPLPDTLVPEVLKLATDRSELVRETLAYYLARVRTPDSKAIILAMIRDRREWIRLYGTVALRRLGDRTVRSELVRLTTDKKPHVRVAALEALMGLKIVEAIDSTASEKLLADSSFHVRAAYAAYLTVVGPNAGDTLARLMRDPSATVRAQALRSFAALRKDSAAEVLAIAMARETWPVRTAAVEASTHLTAERTGGVPSTREAFLIAAARDADVHVRGAAIAAIAPLPTADALAVVLDALKSQDLSVRGTAIGSLGSRREPEVVPAAWQCYVASTGDKWLEARESLVAYLATQVTDQTTAYLREALKDPAASVAIAAREALVRRGVSNLPDAPKRTLTFSPYRTIRFSRNPRLDIKTSRGRFVVELDATRAPIHAATVAGFAAQGKYNKLPWHRVVSNFVVQGGDPDGSGWGGAGFSLRAELHPDLSYSRGALGMPRSSDFDSGSIQLFVTHVPTPHLDDQYTIFGRVVSGERVIDRIEMGDLIENIAVRL